MQPLSYEELEKQYVTLNHEISANNALVKELEESQALYRAIFEHGSVAMTLLDYDTYNVVAYNKKAYEDLGYTQEEYQGMDYRNTILIEDDVFLENMRQIKENKAYVYNTRLRRKDGTVMDAFRSALVVEIGGKKYIHTIRADVSNEKKVKTLLRESEKKYQDILESLKEGYYEVDLAGNITFFNTSLCNMYGYLPEELMGMNNRQYMSPETARKVYEKYNEVYRTGTSKVIEYEAIRKDGSTFNEEASISLIRNENDVITGFRGIVRDVAEKKKIKKQLLESEEMYRTLFEHAGLGISLMDARTGARKAYNKKISEQSGYTEEEFNNVPWQNFVVDQEELQKEINTVVEKGHHYYYIKFRNKNGEIRTFLRSAVIAKFNEKKYFHNIQVDVTDQVKSEEALKESETRFRSIFEDAADPIILMDQQEKKIVNVNKAAEIYLGYTREELLKMSIADVVMASAEGLFNLPSDQSATENIKYFEAGFMRKDNVPVFGEISSCLVEQDNRETVLYIVRDATDRKQKERELEKYRTNLEQMVKEKTRAIELARNELVNRERLAVLGQLTETVSEELKKPLSEIEDSIYLLQRRIKDQDPKIQKHLRRIDSQRIICESIVSDLLEYIRGEKVDRVLADINAWLLELLDQISEMENIQIQRDMPEKISLFLHDPNKMRQVMVNLMNNAVQAVKERNTSDRKYGHGYDPKINIIIKESAETIHFEISDNGVGMDKEIVEKAFEPLFTTRARGTGLGLAYVEKIISEHGGKIFIASEPDEGTTVSFVLPKKGHLADV